MPSRLSAIVTLLLDRCGIARPEPVGYRDHGSHWQHGETRFTPRDPASFEPLDHLYARDAVHGYYRGAVVAGSDGRSFIAVSANEASDRHSVYLCDELDRQLETAA